jgi:hypothetical protein
MVSLPQQYPQPRHPPLGHPLFPLSRNSFQPPPLPVLLANLRLSRPHTVENVEPFKLPNGGKTTSAT